MTLKTAAVGSEVFLQGNYLSVGLSAWGTMGTLGAAPTGFASDKDSGYLRVGLYADLDGFGTGKASTLRDTVLPGNSVEGFTLGYKLGGEVHTESNYGLLMTQEIAGTSTYSTTDNVAQSVWQGATKDKLAVSQTASLVEDGKFIRFDVTLTNNSTESMADVRYMRSMDTDQGSTYSTLNKIVDQGDGKALVSSAATNGTSPAFLYADDPRAVASIFGYKNFDPYVAVAYDTPQAKGLSISSDTTINLTFDLGTLGAGKSTTLSFYVGVTDNLAKTIAQIDTSSPVSTPAPAPAPDVAPDAINDAFGAAYNTAVKGSVLANDKDADGDALTASLVTGPANGTLTLNKDGTFTYTAKSGFSGTDSFVYAASDGTLSDKATVTLTIGAKPNAAPDAINDTFATAYNTAVKGSVLTNDKDADGDALAASLVTGPANGTLTLNKDGTFTYTAKSGFSGTDSFVYAASDGLLSDKATVTLNVGAKPNAAPDAINDTFATAYNTAVKGSVLTNDKDADGNALTASLVTGPANGTLTLNKDGTFTYTAKSGFSGTDSFVYAASDGAMTDKATVTLMIDGPAVYSVLDRGHSIDLSAAMVQSVVGKAGHESFFVDVSAASGKDIIKSFGSSDVLLTTKALLDGNKDGIIAFSAGTTLAVDGANSKDTITFDGDTDALRFLGQTKAGLSVYADADVRPLKAVEGKLSDDVLSGSGVATKATTFFFDTALDVDLGSDKIVKFGVKDLLVTTTEIESMNGKITAAASGFFALPGGSDGGDDHYLAGEGGRVAITDVGSKAVTTLEYDGMVAHDGVHYFVYSQVGSAVGTHDLVF